MEVFGRFLITHLGMSYGSEFMHLSQVTPNSYTSNLIHISVLPAEQKSLIMFQENVYLWQRDLT